MREDRKNVGMNAENLKISPAFWAEKETAVRSVWQEFKRDLLKPQEYRIVAPGYLDQGCSVRDATAQDIESRLTHSHSDMREILLVLEGECEMLIGERIYRCDAGTLMLVNAGDVHQFYYPANSRPSRHVWFMFWAHHIVFAAVTDDGSRQRTLPAFRDYRCFDQYIIDAVCKSWDALLAGDDSLENLAEFETLIRLISVRQVKLYDDALAERDRLSTKRNRDKKLWNVMRYIEYQCGKDCSIDTLAQLSGYSRGHFIRLFKDYAGCSVLDYINCQRRVRYQSLHHNAPLKIVAEQLGFRSVAAFIHWRKQNIDVLQSSDGEPSAPSYKLSRQFY